MKINKKELLDTIILLHQTKSSYEKAFPEIKDRFLKGHIDSLIEAFEFLNKGVNNGK